MRVICTIARKWWYYFSLVLFQPSVFSVSSYHCSSHTILRNPSYMKNTHHFAAFFGLWIDYYKTGRRPHGPFRDFAPPLHYFCSAFVPPNAANDHQRLEPKQSGGDSKLWKVLENCSRVTAKTTAFFNDFLELMRRKKWNNTIFFHFPWGRDFCQRKSYKTLFFGLDAVKQWHFLSFYFLFGGIFSFFLLWMMTLLSNFARVEGLFLLQSLDLTCARSIFQHV